MNQQLVFTNKSRKELILNGLLANLEVMEWSRLERMELLFSKDVTKLSRAVPMINATRMEHHVVIA